MLFSIWNITQNAWATETNFSTRAEAAKLLGKIYQQCRDEYEIRPRKFGTLFNPQRSHDNVRS